jgi:hypothetical protein
MSAMKKIPAILASVMAGAMLAACNQAPVEQTGSGTFGTGASDAGADGMGTGTPVPDTLPPPVEALPDFAPDGTGSPGAGAGDIDSMVPFDPDAPTDAEGGAIPPPQL